MSQRTSSRTKAKAAAAAESADAAAPPPVVASAAASPKLVDLTADSSSSADSPDVVMLSPPAKKSGGAAHNAAAALTAATATPSSAPKVLHPFFTSLTKKKQPTPAANSAAAAAFAIEPVVMGSLEDERKEAPNANATAAAGTAESTQAAAGAAGASAAASSASPPIVPASPSLSSKSELDSLYASKPKAEFFMTGRERVAVRVERKTKEFHAKIEADKAEDKAVIAILLESGKKINPFLLPKPAQPATNAGGSATKERSASGAAGAQSAFSQVSFALPDSTPFPSLCSHVPPPPAPQPHADSTLEWSALHLPPQQSAPEKRKPRVISAPKHLTGLAVNEITALATLAASSSAASASASTPLPASVPLWARAPVIAPVDYLSSSPYRSSDVSNYLGQPRAQAFLKDLAAKLAAHIGGGNAAATEQWSFENVQKLVRRLFIRRVHCYRAAQRDEQQAAVIRKHKAERAAEEAAAEAGEDDSPAASSSPLRTSGASSRSARAAQRGHKSETVEAVAHGDEQISHTFQPRPDSLWSEQYRAFKSDEMFGGNVHQRAQVRDWLKSWSIRQENEEQQKNGTQAASSAGAAAVPAPAPAAEAPLARAARKKTRYVFHSDDEDFDSAWDDVYNPRSASPVRSAPAAASVELANTLLLVGPPCGKTSLIYACCHESDTGIIEIGSNSRRAQRDVLAQCEEATQSHRLALTTVAAGSGLNVAASAAKPTTSSFGVSPVKVKKAEPKSSKKKQKAAAEAAAAAAAPKAKAGFNFFDAVARKNAATAAAAAPAPAAKSKGKKRAAAASSDDESAFDDDDDDFSLSPPKAKKANTKDRSAAPAVAAAPPALISAPVKSVSVTSKKALFAQKTKSTLVAIKGMPDEISDDDDSSDKGSGQKKKQAATAAASSGGKLVQAADFFANPSAFASKAKPTVLSSTVITPGAAAAAASAGAAASGPAADPLAPVSQTSSQTALLFEEIDTVFPQVDRKFLSAVRTLVSNAKRPILLTCNRITKEMCEEKLVLNDGDTPPAGMPIIECIRFEQPSSKDLLPYLYLIAAVEIGFHAAETQSRLPSLDELEQLLLFHNCDVRKTLLTMQLYLTSTPLTLLLGSDNLLLASANPTAAAAALKKRTAQLRLFAPDRTCQQDLILATQGLLDHKEEVISLFDTQAAEQAARALAAPPPKLASKETVLSATAAATALTIAQSEALYAAHNSEVQLLHLNYLSSLLLGAPSAAPDARTGDSMSDESSSASSPHSSWRQLPVRLSVLPLTAEEMYPLHLVQLTPEMLAVSPLLSEEEPSISADPPQSSSAESAPATGDIDMAPSVVDVDASLPPIIEATASLETSEEAEVRDDPSVSPVAADAVPPTTSGATAADAAEVPDDDEDEEAELGARRSSGKKHIATTEEDENGAPPSSSPPVVAIDEDGDESAAIMADQVKRELTAKKQLQALNKLRQEQRTSLREQLIVNEEARRSHLRAANRSRPDRVHNRALDRSLVLLQEMAEMAECISAVDVFTVPVDNTYRSRLSMRSRSRFHPAIHPFVSSSSRDYLPLYLEEDISSSGWVSLEQSWQDEVEEEAERGDRDFKAEAAAKQATLTSLVATTDKKAGAIQVVHDDYPLVTLDASRDMAASLEAYACARMRRATRSAQQGEMPEAHLTQLQTLTTAAVPSMPFPPDVLLPAAPTASPDPIVIDDDSNQVDLTLSPSPVTVNHADIPAAAPSADAAASASPAHPLFLPSLDAPIPPLSIQVFRSPSSITPEHRREMSQLMHYVWNHLQWSQHAPTSVSARSAMRGFAFTLLVAGLLTLLLSVCFGL